MSESSDQILECSKEQDGKETNLKQVLNETNLKLHENNYKGEGLTDAFIVDLLNESSNDSSSDSDIIPPPCSNTFHVIDSCNDMRNGMTNNSLVSSANDICDGDENSEKSKVSETISKSLTPKSVEQSDEIIRETIQQAVNEVSMSEIESSVRNVASDILSKVEMSSLQLGGAKCGIDQSNNFNGHRETEEWTDDESASSTSSSDSDGFFEELHKVSTPKINPIKTKGELDIEDLPPIEELNISVEKSELTKVGKVHAIVTKQVVVQAIKDHTPLDMDSVLFLSENEPLGRVFEVFGPVVEPFYVVLFNSAEDIMKKNITVGTEVYFAPKKRDITMYVFLDALRQQKGSDASWTDNNEPPEEFLDYSDDEQERIAKSKRRAKNRNREDDDEVDIIAVKSKPKSEDSECDSTGRTSINQRRLNSAGNSYANMPQNNYTSKHITRNSVTPENSKCTSNRPYSSHSMNSLDNVPVWISSPPSFLEMVPISSSAINVHNTSPLQALSFSPAPVSFSHPKLEHSSSVSANSPQFRVPQIQLRPPVFQAAQPFIPSQQTNINAAPIYLQNQSSFNSSQRINNAPSPQPAMLVQSQSPFMPNRVNRSNTYSPQSPIVFQTQNSLINKRDFNIQPNHTPLQFQSSPMLSNYRQPYVFGQVTQMPVISSPVQSTVAPMHVYASTPPPHVSGSNSHQWQQREALQTPPQPALLNANHQWQQREALRTPPQPALLNTNHQWQQREAQRTPPLPVSLNANHQWQQREVQQTPPFLSPLRVQIPSFTNLPPVVRFSASNAYPIPTTKPLYYSASHQNLSYSSRF